MPKQTFFNLPAKKKQTLIESTKREFSRVPLNKASIANIVKDADIPRGSFYQYFEDKEDAFYYLLEQQMEVHNNQFLAILKKNNGDIFDSFIGIFHNMLMEFQNKDNRDFFKNVFLNMNYKMEKKLTAGFSKEKKDEQFTAILNAVDISTLNIEHKDEAKHVYQIITAITTHNLMNNFANKTSFEEAVEDYAFEINLLKAGLYKKDM